jgi:lipoprotein-anchoring transpeptidase ErfK/SrfK
LSSGAEPSANQAASWNSDVSKQAAADRGAAGGFALPPLPGGSPSDPSGGSQTTPAAMAAGAMAAGALAASATQGTPGQPTQSGLVNAVQQADRQFAADQPAQALATLSLFYHTPGITESDRAALLSRLDPLAGIVIYSRRHMLEQPHRVGQSETLMEVAARYEIPWQLLANINAIEDPVTVLPGTELKVVRGPFRGEVDLTRSELTIFLGDLYAGRFPIKVNNEAAPAEGTYTVLDKQNSQTFYDKDGSPIAPEDPRNPYGNLWIDLGQKLCIHGSPNPGDFSPAGCISLRGRDAGDLMGILSQGSAITVRR